MSKISVTDKISIERPKKKEMIGVKKVLHEF